MSKELVSDELWQIVEPLLPIEPPKARGSGLWFCMFIRPRYMLRRLLWLSERGIALSPGPNA
jgi:hypothetical protein